MATIKEALAIVEASIAEDREKDKIAKEMASSGRAGLSLISAHRRAAMDFFEKMAMEEAKGKAPTPYAGKGRIEELEGDVVKLQQNIVELNHKLEITMLTLLETTKMLAESQAEVKEYREEECPTCGDTSVPKVRPKGGWVGIEGVGPPRRTPDGGYVWDTKDARWVYPFEGTGGLGPTVTHTAPDVTLRPLVATDIPYPEGTK